MVPSWYVCSCMAFTEVQGEGCFIASTQTASCQGS